MTETNIPELCSALQKSDEALRAMRQRATMWAAVYDGPSGFCLSLSGLDLRGLIASDREAMLLEFDGITASGREHKYRGGPPPQRLKRMQLAHELRARKAGVRWDMVDLREVYRRHNGICGICLRPVGFEEFTVDHIIALANGGPHLLQNLQPAHASCNSAKGDS